MNKPGEQAAGHQIGETSKLLRAQLHLAKVKFVSDLNDTVWSIFQELKDGPHHRRIPDRLRDYSYEQVPRYVRLLTENARNFFADRRSSPTAEDEQLLDWYIRRSVTDWIAAVWAVAAQYLAYAEGRPVPEGMSPVDQLEADIVRHLPMAKILLNATHQLAVLDSAAKLGLHELREALRQSPELEITAAGGSSANVFRWDGDGWNVEFDGDAANFPPRIGMAFLHVLLSSPGRLWRPMELARMVDKPATADGAGVGASRREVLSTTELEEGGLADAGEIMDDRCVRSVREKIRELDEGIAEASQRGDAETAGRLTEEKDELVQHLAAAHGLGGRKRKDKDPHERVRIPTIPATDSEGKRPPNPIEGGHPSERSDAGC